MGSTGSRVLLVSDAWKPSGPYSLLYAGSKGHGWLRDPKSEICSSYNPELSVLVVCPVKALNAQAVEHPRSRL